MIVHNMTYPVLFHDCAPDGYATASSMLRYMIETSLQQTEMLMKGYMGERNFGWVLYKWQARIDDYPKALEEVEVKTYAMSFDRFYAYRKFEVYRGGRLIAEGVTTWLLVDGISFKPMRIPKELAALYGSSGEPQALDRKPPQEPRVTLSSKTFQVRHSDIDGNDHVNNIKYLEWFLESIADSIDGPAVMNELELVYKKQVLYGEKVTVALGVGDEDGTDRFLGRIVGKDGDLRAYGKILLK